MLTASFVGSTYSKVQPQSNSTDARAFLSVIVPALYPTNLADLLASLLNQSFDRESFEVLIVGIVGKDQIPEDLTYPIRYIETKSAVSPSTARNIGAGKATGEVLVFTDSDCTADAKWLAEIEKKYKDPNVHVLGGGVRFPKGNYWQLSSNISMFHDYFWKLDPGTRCQLPSLNLAIRKDAFFEVDGFDERYPRASGEDADLTLRLHCRGYKLLFHPKAVIEHRPLRNSLRSLLQHGFYHGKYSTKIDPRYSGFSNLPLIFRTRAGLLVFSLLIALGASIRIFLEKSVLRSYFYTMPAIFLTKFTWCIGASFHPCVENDQ